MALNSKMPFMRTALFLLWDHPVIICVKTKKTYVYTIKYIKSKNKHTYNFVITVLTSKKRHSHLMSNTLHIYLFILFDLSSESYLLLNRLSLRPKHELPSLLFRSLFQHSKIIHAFNNLCFIKHIILSVSLRTNVLCEAHTCSRVSECRNSEELNAISGDSCIFIPLAEPAGVRIFNS